MPLDRYPRAIVRRIVRGKAQASGHDLIFLNLRKGLDRLDVPYRTNDYKYIRKNSDEIACIIGKPHVLEKVPVRTPVVFGSAQFSHPLEDPAFFAAHPNIRLILVQGEWVRKMWEPYLGARVAALPIGIDTELWKPTENLEEWDFLLYDKVRWNHEVYEETLIGPIRREFRLRGLSFTELRYGQYRQEDYRTLLKRCRGMVFLCEHETQGFAYQQALSSGVPILAWDRGGYWQDPSFYPRLANFEPVSSVPYWDDRCGLKFHDANEFGEVFENFWTQVSSFHPRAYILENLTLEKCAARYLDIVMDVEAAL